MSKKHKYTNRLINEKSPYLLQHAHNPVDWYPWGSEAFFAAKKLDLPIFLSIGYATCHWCHVMEKESFENEVIGKMLNDSFINIKVDREELPEVDLLYMEFAQSMLPGVAGWPLNLLLTPDLEPFFAATYLPAFSKEGALSLKEVIEKINQIWRGDEKESVTAQAKEIVRLFESHVHTKGNELPGKDLIEVTSELLLKLADPIYGGLKGAPKFPIAYQYNFLIREAKFTGDSRAVFFVERSLDMMHRGGIYDHLGGGFSRYSVDEKWQVPHFEKMLYDNALLTHSYLEIWQATKCEMMKQVCEEIIAYISNDMRFLKGGFFSAEDADSEGKEGLFYTWSFAEIVDALGESESEWFCDFYQVTKTGNFEGRNILNTPLNAKEFCELKQINLNDFEKKIKKQKEILKNIREKRVRPFKDDKILTSWNGLMIFSLAEAGRAFSKSAYINQAKAGAQFIEDQLWNGETLLRRWRKDEGLYTATLDDYAFFIRALISLFEVDCGVRWLTFALKLTAVLEDQFKEERGAFYITDGKDPNILIRKCQFSDGAEPSGNAVHCENLLRLYQITGNPHYLSQAEDIFRAVQSDLAHYSVGYCYHVLSLMRYFDKKAPTFVLSLNEKEEFFKEIIEEIYTQFIPHKSIVVRRVNDEKLFSTLPYVKEQVPISGKTTLYICFEGVCSQPLCEIDQIISAIKQL